MAIQVGDASGTNQADQLYFEADGVTTLPTSFNVIITVSDDQGNELGRYKASDGTSLGDAGSWTGSLSAELAANTAGTAGDGLQMNFTKLLFAALQGWTYTKARTLLFSIQVQKGETSLNGGNVLIMPLQENVGTLFAPRDIDIRDGLIYSSQFQSENVLQQGIVNVQLSGKLWSKNNFRSQTTNRGVHARVFADTASASGLSVVYSKQALDRTRLFRSKITGFDADGFPIFATEEDINGVGDAAASTASESRIAVAEAFFSGGMPLMIITKSAQKSGSFRTASILANTGTPAAPDYSVHLNTNIIDANMNQCGIPRADQAGRIYFRHFGGGINRFSRLVYSGPNNDSAQLTTASNWSAEPIGVAAALAPALGGDGSTAQFDGWTVAIDDDNPVNGEPVIFYGDNINHVIFKIVRNASAFGDERDWTWTVFAGQSGVTGFADGIGAAATFDQPEGIVYDGGFLYVNDYGNNLLRRIDVSTAQVETIFGQQGVGGHVNQFTF